MAASPMRQPATIARAVRSKQRIRYLLCFPANAASCVPPTANGSFVYGVLISPAWEGALGPGLMMMTLMSAVSLRWGRVGLSSFVAGERRFFRLQSVISHLRVPHRNLPCCGRPARGHSFRQCHADDRSGRFQTDTETPKPMLGSIMLMGTFRTTE